MNVCSLIKNAVKEIQRRACVEWDSESEQQINPETSADVRGLLSGTHHQEIPSPSVSFADTETLLRRKTRCQIKEMFKTLNISAVTARACAAVMSERSFKSSVFTEMSRGGCDLGYFNMSETRSSRFCRAATRAGVRSGDTHRLWV